MNENEYAQKLAAGKIETIDPVFQEQAGGGENPIGLWGKLLPFVYGPIKTILLGGWKSYTPILQQGATEISKTVMYAKYLVIGKICFVRVKLQITGTGSANQRVHSTLPITGLYTNWDEIGTASYFDADAYNYGGGAQFYASGDYVQLTVGGAIPIGTGFGDSMTVANGDYFVFNVFYEIA